MPANLRFVALLLGLGVIGALLSGVVQHRETTAQAKRAAEAMAHGRVAAGRAAIVRLGCGACHVIPGIAVATGQVGPTLDGVAGRAMIGGRLANDPANLAIWIRSPQHVSPGTGMPAQPMSQQQARDIAAYLYTLKP